MHEPRQPHSDDRRRHLDALLAIHRTNLHRLEQQAAAYGLTPPLHLLHSIDHERIAIARAEAELWELGVRPEWSRSQPTAEPRSEARSVAPMRPPPPADLAAPARRTTSAPLVSARSPRERLRRAARAARSSGLASRAASAGALLLLAVFGLALLRARPNPTLIDALRPELPGTQTIGIGVHGGALAFDRDQIDARTGQIVVVSFANSADQRHSWVLVAGGDEVAAGLVATGELVIGRPDVIEGTRLLAPGESEQATFVIGRPGTYVYLCGAPGHYAAGMKGVLRVRE